MSLISGIKSLFDLFMQHASIFLTQRSHKVILSGDNCNKQQQKVVNSLENDDVFDSDGMNVNAWKQN